MKMSNIKNLIGMMEAINKTKVIKEDMNEAVIMMMGVMKEPILWI